MKLGADDKATFNKYWQAQRKLDAIGRSSDYVFLSDTPWLPDAAVIDRIECSAGRWHVYLVFVDPEATSNFIMRAIRTCPSLQKAELTANYMRRLSGRDVRGEISISLRDFECSSN